MDETGQRRSRGLPPAQGLYDPAQEHDSCGVGFLAHLDGRRTHGLVTDGVEPRDEIDGGRGGACGEADDEIVACGALKVYSAALAEVGALAVSDAWQGRGLGRVVVEALIAGARELGLQEVFALTRKPAFFLRLGFGPAEREQFPLKVWADCARCPRQSCCDEIAVTLPL